MEYTVDYFDESGKMRTVEVQTTDERLIPFKINSQARRRKDRVDKIYQIKKGTKCHRQQSEKSV